MAPGSSIHPTSIRCASCGYDLSGTAVGGVCPECGMLVEETIKAKTRGPDPLPNNGCASWSVGLGILGMCFWPVAPVALALSILANRQMRRGQYAKSSENAAMIGGILGFLGTLFMTVEVLGIFFG